MFHKKKYVTVGLAIAATIGVLISVKLIFFSHPVCKDCNVILISLDTLSANHLPCYGYNRNTAPNLCKFGEDNIMFTNMYANASWTLPSHVSIFTGLYPSQHKVNAIYKDVLSPNIAFLPDILRKNGYNTYFYMGYQTYYETPPYNPLLPIDKVYNRGIDEIHNAYNTSDWKEGLQKLKTNNDSGKKTFLFLHTYWTHKPYLFTQDEKRQFINNTYEDPNDPSIKWNGCAEADQFIPFLEKELKRDIDAHYWEEDKALNPIYKQIYNYLITSTDDKKATCDVINENWYWQLEWYYYTFHNPKLEQANKRDHLAYTVNLYDSKIFELDSQMKNIFSFIDASNLKRNTIIIVTSDHGEEFLEHGQFAHENNLYDTTVKVPLMIYIPGQGKQTNTGLTESVDLFPTLLRLIGIKQSFVLSGRDIFAFNPDQKYAVSEQIHEGGVIRTIRDLNWKLILKQGNPVELYNYAKDKKEQTNLIKEGGGVRDSLKSKLRGILSIEQRQ